LLASKVYLRGPSGYHQFSGTQGLRDIEALPVSSSEA